MLRRLLSLIIAISISTGVMPVYAAQNSKNDIEARKAEMEAQALADGVILDEPVPYVLDPDATQEPEEDIEENVHTETITGDIELQEESERLLDEPEISLFSTEEDYSKLWKSLFSDYFGDDYLAPYKGNKDGQRVTGKTNRLVIEETDLSLPGKNGLDLNIRRKHDNQYYNSVYSSIKYDVSNDIYIDRYGYGFTNSSTNENIYVLFTNEDDFYIYMKNGITINSLPDPYDNKKINGTYVDLYLFESIYKKKSNTGITLTYNSSMREINDTEKTTGKYDLEDRKLLPKDNFLGGGWDLVLPSASLHRYIYDTYTDGYPKSYKSNYIGAFRDIDGNVFSFEGYDQYKIYKDSDTTYTSSFKCNDNKYFTLTSYYAVQSLYEGGPQYNFEVKDNRGIKYYFFNTGLDGKPSRNQKMYIAAIQDEYGNTIRYEYGDRYEDGVVKIIDTYGREVNINHTNYNTVISYNDDNNIEKQIVYHREILPASTLNTGILKDKDVSRFSVTNAEGETTIYDSRGAYVSNVIATTNNPINEVPTINNIARESSSYNIERIIYPTGAETRYLYKRLYLFNEDAKVLNGLYGVESTYDIDGGVVSNKKEYQFANASNTITKTVTDVSKSAKSIETYNQKGLLTKSITSANGTTSSSPYTSVTNTYDTNDNLTKQVVNNNGISNTTDYTYNSGYPESVSSITTDRSEITYTYHSVGGKLTNVPNVITYKFKSGSTYETDYSVENTINEQKSIVMTKKIKNNGINAQSKYVYDNCGRVISTLEWTGKGNSDEVLDENDEYVQINTSYSETPSKAVNVGMLIENLKDADGNNAEDVSELYKYNIYGYPVEKDDTYGIATNIAYDSLSRPTKYTYANGAVRTNVYNTAGKYTITTDEAGTQTKNTYNGFGKLLTKQYNNNGTWEPLIEYTYDSSGRPASCINYTNSDNYTKETYTYDVLDRLTQKIVYKGLSTRLYTENYSYTVTGDQLKIVKTTSAADNSAAPTETEYYDKYGRLTKKEASAGATTMTNEYTYDYKDNMLTETDAKGNTTTYEYDLNNQMTRKTLPDEHIYTWTYDMLGRMVYSFDSAPFAYTMYQYDTMNREIYRRTPFGNNRTELKTYYDANSNIIKKLQQNNADDRTSEDTFAQTLYTYDDMNNLIGVTSNSGSRDEAVQYWYDNANRVIAMQTGRSSVAHNIAIPSSGAVTRYEYDALGYLSKETDSLGKSSEYNNDYAGNVISGVDRNQNYFDYTYGPYGITYSLFRRENSEEEEYYTYDSLGRLKKKFLSGDNGNDYENYTYDAFGRVTEQSGSDYKNCYTYDLNSNVATYILKQDNTVKNSESYEYDETNHLTKQNINGKIITYTYSDGLMLEKNVDGIETRIVYNAASLPTSYVTTKGDTTYASYTYTYRLDGNRISEEDTVNNLTRAYTYDNIGRLTGESISGDMNLNTTYAYDMRGNRTSKAVTGDENYTVSSTYDNNNRLTKQTKSVGGTQTEGAQYYYDNNGNQTFKQRFTYSTGELMSMSIGTKSDDIESFTYNAKNQLTGYTKGSTNASYTYGANGLRKSKTVGSTVTGFLWNGQNLAAETNGSTVKNVYSYGPDGIQCGKINGSDILYVKDAHGNTVTTLNGSKESIRDYTYDAFGNQLGTVSSSDTNPFRYCGEYYDNESGNIYLRARYYDSKNGRFIMEDTIKDGLNWYSYCAGNPIMFVDQLGLTLQLEGTGDQVQTIWNNIKDLSRDELLLTQQRDENGNLIDVYNVTVVEERNDCCVAGTTLLRRIIDSDKNCSIKICPYDISATDYDEKLAIQGGGSDAEIVFRPKNNEQCSPSVDPESGDVVNIYTPDFIVLAHELCHADRAMRGASLKYSDKEIYKYQVGRLEPKFNIHRSSWSEYIYEKQKISVEELANIGLKYNRDNDITENMIREDHGIWKRGAYFAR